MGWQGIAQISQDKIHISLVHLFMVDANLTRLNSYALPMHDLSVKEGREILHGVAAGEVHRGASEGTRTCDTTCLSYATAFGSRSSTANPSTSCHNGVTTALLSGLKVNSPSPDVKHRLPISRSIDSCHKASQDDSQHYPKIGSLQFSCY